MKQVIVMRKDLNMRKGKMCTQAAHASMKVLLDRNIAVGTQTPFISSEMLIIPISDIKEWIYGLFTKVVVGVDNEPELLRIYQEAVDKKLPCALIQDAGKTEFKEPTYTCCAIGPAKEEDIDVITGELRLI